MASESILRSVGYYRSPSGGAPGPATIGPDTLLFELITAGAVWSPDGERCCGPGWIFAHAAGEQTIWRSPPERYYECVTIQFDARRMPERQDWPRAFCWDPEAGALAFARDMLHDFHHQTVSRAIQGELIWSQLRYRLAQFERLALPAALPAPIASVVAHIDAHHVRDLGIEDLAAVARLSPSQLHARFKACLGSTPHQYLVQQRMRSARQLLVTTDDPISAIARAVGYGHTESFCRSFRRLHGSTAVSYRRRHTRGSLGS